MAKTKVVISISPGNKQRLATFGDASNTIDECLDTILSIAERARARGDL